AGILELADVIVIHKADLPGAEQTAAQVRAALELSPRGTVPIVRVSSKQGQGHAELWDAIQALPLRRRPSAAGEELLRLAQELLARRLRRAEAGQDGELARLLEEWRQGAQTPDAAAQRLLRLLAAAQE